ncbi:MAG TPA: bifunctional phosphoribosylaminoimidazolecarboxamide formyltransferase/IMP cyclohydrolase [Patescibacteria group bacterium]|nr:bifunctional phosphoribosylaminoimidazolecarboxamide formyltransferase/IMP cyclohydrolase [Patescibacteria group bacterium]
MSELKKRALISVTDKRGVAQFAAALHERKFDIIASGGTAAALRDAGVPVTEISDVTGFPETMDGRIKTLHPKIHGGILADRSKEEHLAAARDLGIDLIDIVAVNLYRFSEAAADPALDVRDIVEQIDIGGPTLIRSAAKNFHCVTVVVDPGDYDSVIGELDRGDGAVSPETRRRLASKAFHHTASYDAAISIFFEGLETDVAELPDEIITVYRKIRPLRYGENPHLRAALYRTGRPVDAFGDFMQHQGKELSYNNIQDMYSAFLLARDLGGESCAIIKHMNPCGAASCGNPLESFLRARRTDPVSAFGSVVAINGEVSGEIAEACIEGYIEVIMAKGFTDSAIARFKKRKNLRLITVETAEWERDLPGWVSREIGGLLLVQDRDEGFPELAEMKLVTSRAPSESEEKALHLAWRTVKHVRSNAIVICDDAGTIGVGAGQMSRVDSCRIAVDKAHREGLAIEGASAASDAFFPFPDGVEVLVEAGVVAVVQPGGSINDQKVIDAAERLGITMLLTGRRHFRH